MVRPHVRLYREGVRALAVEPFLPVDCSHLRGYCLAWERRHVHAARKRGQGPILVFSRPRAPSHVSPILQGGGTGNKVVTSRPSRQTAWPIEPVRLKPNQLGRGRSDAAVVASHSSHETGKSVYLFRGPEIVAAMLCGNATTPYFKGRQLSRAGSTSGRDCRADLGLATCVSLPDGWLLD